MSKPAFIIFIIALLVRGLVAMPGYFNLEYGGTYTADSPRYERLALTLIEEGKYEAHPLITYKGLDHEIYSGPEYFRVPGYPLFIAGIFSVFGYSTPAVITMQILLAAFTCVLVYYIGRSMHSAMLGIVAAALMILNIKAGIHAGQITSEIFFTFLFALTTLSVIHLWRKQTIRTALLCALLFAMLALTRPIGMHLAIILVVTAAAGLRTHKAILLTAIPLLAVIVALQAWSYRNYSHSGVWAPTSNSSITLGMHFPALIWAHAHDKTERDGQIEIFRRLAEKYPQYEDLYIDARNDSEVMYLWRKGYVHDPVLAGNLKPIGIRLMLEEWPAAIQTAFTGMIWTFFSGMGEWRGWVITVEQYRALKKYIPLVKKQLARREFPAAFSTILNAVQVIPLLALATFLFMGILSGYLLIAAIAGLRGGLLSAAPLPAGWLLLLWIGYISVTAGIPGNSRYLAPALPLLSIAAAFGTLYFHKAWRSLRDRGGQPETTSPT